MQSAASSSEPSPSSPSSSREPPISIGTKLSYGVGDFANVLSWSTINSWYLYYLVEVVGVNGAAAGALMMGGKIIDAVLDPVVGMASDRTRTRWGRRRPFLLFGAIPFALTFAALWWLPMNAPLWLVGIGLALHMFCFALCSIPYAALTPEIAQGYEERSSLTGYRMAFSLFSSLVAAAAPLALATYINGGTGSLPLGWGVTATAFGAVAIVCWLICVAGVRERPLHASEAPHAIDLGRDLRSLAGAFGFKEIVAVFVIQGLALAMVQGMLPFHLAMVGLDEGTTSLMLLLAVGTSILMLPAWTIAANRIGKKEALIAGAVIYAAGLNILALLVPDGYVSALLLVTCFVVGIGLSSLVLLPWAMIPDVIEFDELRTGQRREGLVYAVWALSQKLANAGGIFVNGLVLSAAGYVRGAAQQSEETERIVELSMGPLIAVILATSLVFAFRYPITRANHAAAREELARRTATSPTL